ncbi:MAG: biopolymer transporter ExbD [Crocinitomix sp.]|nr:biopolymer transporter ExbD [Crocinitomix sp.]
MNLGRRNRVKAEGGMSSMTDLVFLMLIFFIIMSTMTSPGINVNLPNSDSIAVENSQPEVHVGITPNNLYNFQEAQEVLYTFEEIEPLIIQKMDEDLQGNNKIKISGDQDADYQYVFKVIGLAKKNEWNPVLVFKNN